MLISTKEYNCTDVLLPKNWASDRMGILASGFIIWNKGSRAPTCCLPVVCDLVID